MRKSVIIFFITLGGFMLNSCNETKQIKIGFSGNDIINDVAITKDKKDKTTFLHVNIQGKWSLYAGTSGYDIDTKVPILEGNEEGTFQLNIPTDKRYYFELVTEKGSAILSETHLPMEGGFNFRDLGGIKNSDGRYTKWGKVFRADELNGLTDNDLDYLSSIPIISIVDFRSQEEVEKAPDRNPSSLKTNYAYSINPGNQLAMSPSNFLDYSEITEEHADIFMANLNQLLVTDSVCIEHYKNFFALLQNNDDIPLLFHCTAGKDRTGMGAALFLASLNVGEDAIFSNYLDSNKYLENKYAKLKETYPQISAFFEVKPQFLKAGFDQIKKDYGTIENFLKNTLKVDLEKMQSMYLY